ncbi:TetR/AcrR family transcriptional regulator [Falsiroseomonas sp. HW251]|uniref:TetR/AcrR family transcriptional regulator n=1 Tax=Falsiroseomonas sp. HW251 TaxID=3390998 RepID=UPI003D3174B9
MARTRAADHDQRRFTILMHAAEQFAKHGYDRASQAMIAKAAGVSKTLAYHYWPDKEAMLFEVLEHHLRRLVDIARIAPNLDMAPREQLESFARMLLEAYQDADAVHRVQIACLSLLSPERQATLKAMEREMVQAAAGIIAELHPGTPEALLKPLTMSFFAMLNWHYLWHREGAALSREDYATVVAAMIASGTPGVTEAFRGRLKPRVRLPEDAR